MRGERWPRRPEPALPRGTPTHGSGAGAGAGDRASSSHPHSAEPAPVPTGVPFVPGRGAGATGLRSDGRDQHTQGWGAPPATPVHTGRGRAGGSRNSPRGSCAGGTPASCSPPPARPGASHTRVSHTGPQGPTRTRQAAGGPGPRGERPSPRRPPPAATGTASVRPTVPPSPACGFQRVHWASARSMPCNGSAPGSPLPQDLASSAPCCMAGAPTGRGGRGPEWGGAWGCWGGLLALPRTRPQAVRPLAGATAALTWKRRTELSLPFVTQATCTHRPQHCPSSAWYSKPCGGGEA